MGKEKYYVDCRSCRLRYRLLPANTVIYVFSDRLYCSYAESTCECGDDSLNFADVEELKEMSRQKFPMVPVTNCPPSVIRQWERINETELLKPVALTPRHEELIESLRVMLEKTPDHHLMGIFESPPPKSDLPRSWL